MSLVRITNILLVLSGFFKHIFHDTVMNLLLNILLNLTCRNICALCYLSCLSAVTHKIKQSDNTQLRRLEGEDSNKLVSTVSLDISQ